MKRYEAYKSVLPGFVYLTRYSEANDANVPAPEGEYVLASDVADLERRLSEAVERLLMHVGLHGMPTAALEQDAEFARAALQDDDPHGPVTEDELDAARVQIRTGATEKEGSMKRYEVLDAPLEIREAHDGEMVYYSDVADFERRYREAVELLKRYEAEEWRVTCDWSNSSPWERLQADRDAFLTEEAKR